MGGLAYVCLLWIPEKASMLRQPVRETTSVSQAQSYCKNLTVTSLANKTEQPFVDHSLDKTLEFQIKCEAIN